MVVLSGRIRAGFFGLICAHTLLLLLTIHQVSYAVNVSSEQKICSEKTAKHISVRDVRMILAAEDTGLLSQVKDDKSKSAGQTH